MEGEGEGNYEERLKRLFERYAPENVSKIPSYLKKYKGQEEEMMKTFTTKYGPEESEQEKKKESKKPATVKKVKKEVAEDAEETPAKPVRKKKEQVAAEEEEEKAKDETPAKPARKKKAPAEEQTAEEAPAKPARKKNESVAAEEKAKEETPAKPVRRKKATEEGTAEETQKESKTAAVSKSKPSKNEKPEPSESTTTKNTTSSPTREKKRAMSANSDKSNKKVPSNAKGRDAKEEEEEPAAAKSRSSSSSKKRTADGPSSAAVDAEDKRAAQSKKKEKPEAKEETPAKRVKKQDGAGKEAPIDETDKEVSGSPAKATKPNAKQPKPQKEGGADETPPAKPRRKSIIEESAADKAPASKDKAEREQTSPAKRGSSKKRRTDSMGAGATDAEAKQTPPPPPPPAAAAEKIASSKKKKEPVAEEERVSPAKPKARRETQEPAPVERRPRSNTKFPSPKPASSSPTQEEAVVDEPGSPAFAEKDAPTAPEAFSDGEEPLEAVAKSEFDDELFDKRMSLSDDPVGLTASPVPPIDIPSGVARTPASIRSTGAQRTHDTAKGSQKSKSVKKSEQTADIVGIRQIDAAKVLIPTRGTSAEDIQLEALELTIQEVLAMHDVEKLDYARRMAQKYAPSRFDLFNALEEKYKYEEGELTRIYMDTKQALERGCALLSYGTRGPWTLSPQKNPSNSFGSRGPDVPEGKQRSVAGSIKDNATNNINNKDEVHTPKSAHEEEAANGGDDEEKFTDALDEENREDDDAASVTESFWCTMTDEMGIFTARRDALAARLEDFFDIACPAKKHLAIDLATMHAANPRELVQRLSDAYGRELAYMVFVTHDQSATQNAAANGQTANLRRPPTKIIGDESAETLQAYPFLPPISSPSTHEFSPIMQDDCNKAPSPLSPQPSRRAASAEKPVESRTIPLPENAQRYLRAAQELALFYGMSATYVDRVHAQVRCSPLGQRRVESPLISARLSTTSSRRGVLDSVRGAERPFVADDIYDDWIDDNAYEERVARTVLIEVVTAIFPEAVLCALQDDSQRVAFVAKRLAQFFSFHDPRFVDSVNDVLLQYCPPDANQRCQGTFEGTQAYVGGYPTNGTAHSEHWHSNIAQLQQQQQQQQHLQQQLFVDDNDLRYAVGDVLIEYYGPLMYSIQGFSFDWDILPEPQEREDDWVSQQQQQQQQNGGTDPEENARREATNLRHRHMKEAINAWASEFGSHAAAAWGSTGSRLTAPTRTTLRPPVLTDASVDTEELSASIEAKHNAELLQRNVEVLTSKCDTGIMTDPRPNYEEFRLKEKLAEVRAAYYGGNQRTFGSKPSSTVLPAREHPSCYALSNTSVLLETDSCPRCALIQAQLDTVRGELQRQHSEKLSLECMESSREAERKYLDTKLMEGSRQRSESSRVSSSGLSSDMYSRSARSSTRELSEPALVSSRGFPLSSNGHSGTLVSASQNHVPSHATSTGHSDDTVQHLRQRLRESYDTARKSQMQAYQAIDNGGGGGVSQRFFGPDMLSIKPSDARNSRKKQTTTSSTTMTNLTGEHLDGIRRYFLLDTL